VVSRVFSLYLASFCRLGERGRGFCPAKEVCTLCPRVHVGSFTLAVWSFLDCFRLIRLLAFEHDVRHDVRHNRVRSVVWCLGVPWWPSREPLPLTVRSWCHLFMLADSASDMTCGESGHGSPTSRWRGYVEGMERRTSRPWRARCVGLQTTYGPGVVPGQGVSGFVFVQTSGEVWTPHDFPVRMQASDSLDRGSSIVTTSRAFGRTGS
jgi:hypothetical protein